MHALRSTVGDRGIKSPTRVDRESGTRFDPLIGYLVGGKYRIERVLAEGGMGRVYLATQESVGRPVALKVVRHEDEASDSDHEAQRRFRFEAAVLARLRHPSIVTLYDFGDLENAFSGRSYLAMELLEGQTLAERMDAVVRLPVGEVLALTEQLVRGLRFAHGQGVVHRDMKPSNVMLLSDDLYGRSAPVLKILDFGTSKAVDNSVHRASSTRLTQEGYVVGTPEYMAPEQLEGRPGPASDLFSVGVMMFEALTGALPFDSRGKLIARPPSPRLRTVAPDLDVPDSVEDLVASLLSLSPAERPTSKELLDSLRTCALEADAYPASRTVPRSDAAAMRRKSRIALGAGALALVCMAGASLLLGAATEPGVAPLRAARSPHSMPRQLEATSLVKADRPAAPAQGEQTRPISRTLLAMSVPGPLAPAAPSAPAPVAPTAASTSTSAPKTVFSVFDTAQH